MIAQWIIALAAQLVPGHEATLVFAGDAMQHQKQIDVAKSLGANGSYDYDDCFADITQWVSDADYSIVNLETPLGNGSYTGYPCFNAPKEFAIALKDAGFDLFLTANNHTLDRRDKGLRRTLAVLDSLGVDHIGTYDNGHARNVSCPLIKDVKGYKIAFLNYTYGTNGIKIQGNVIVDLIDRKGIADDVSAARKAGAELVVVAMHWGVEYVLNPPKSVADMADYLSSLEVDMIIGGHPHVIQPMEMRYNRVTGRPLLLVYSLGNLISNMTTRDTRGGAMVKAVVDRDENGEAFVKAATFLPHFTVPGQQGKGNFRIVPLGGEAEKTIPSQWRPQLDMWKSSSLKTLTDKNVNVCQDEI